MLHRVRHVIKCRVTVRFVVRRVKKGGCVLGRGMDLCGFDGPNGDALRAAAINVPCVFDRHLGINGVQGANVFVGEALFGAEENFPERPVFHFKGKI